MNACGKLAIQFNSIYWIKLMAAPAMHEDKHRKQFIRGALPLPLAFNLLIWWNWLHQLNQSSNFMQLMKQFMIEWMNAIEDIQLIHEFNAASGMPRGRYKNKMSRNARWRQQIDWIEFQSISASHTWNNHWAAQPLPASRNHHFIFISPIIN